MSEINDEKPPKVFISYSHDTPIHKKWVGELASKLMDSGVEVLLDQWEIDLGDDIPKFMEKSVIEANCVLMICTEAYVRKADDGKGGVGYEAMIVTGELVKDLGTSKFVPIIRQENNTAVLPRSMSTRLYVDLSEGKNFEEGFLNLLHRIHDVPKVKKPALGKNPFKNEDLSTPASATSGEPATPPTPMDETSAVYRRALQLARANDLVEWRRLVRQIKQAVFPKLVAWEKECLRKQPTLTELPNLVMEAATTCAPLMAVALAGVESGNEKFKNQIALIDELLAPKDWIGNGPTVIVDIPDVLVCIYQALHGALCLETDQVPLALAMARTRIQRPHDSESSLLWQDHQLIGWPESLGHTCTTTWSLLMTLPEKWPWLLEIFGSTEDFQVSLGAYYLALSVQEFANILQKGREKLLTEKELFLDIPLSFASGQREIARKSYRLLLRNAGDVRTIWRSLGVTDGSMFVHWPAWIEHNYVWLKKAHRFAYSARLPQEKLFEDLPPQT
jgi:hypothetical protein